MNARGLLISYNHLRYFGFIRPEFEKILEGKLRHTMSSKLSRLENLIQERDPKKVLEGFGIPDWSKSGRVEEYNKVINAISAMQGMTLVDAAYSDEKFLIIDFIQEVKTKVLSEFLDKLASNTSYSYSIGTQLLEEDCFGFVPDKLFFIERIKQNKCSGFGLSNFLKDDLSVNILYSFSQDDSCVNPDTSLEGSGVDYELFKPADQEETITLKDKIRLLSTKNIKFNKLTERIHYEFIKEFIDELMGLKDDRLIYSRFNEFDLTELKCDETKYAIKPVWIYGKINNIELSIDNPFGCPLEEQGPTIKFDFALFQMIRDLKGLQMDPQTQLYQIDDCPEIMGLILRNPTTSDQYLVVEHNYKRDFRNNLGVIYKLEEKEKGITITDICLKSYETLKEVGDSLTRTNEPTNKRLIMSRIESKIIKSFRA